MKKRYYLKTEDPDWISQERERGRLKQERYRQSGKGKTSNRVKAFWAGRNQEKLKAQRKAAFALKCGLIKKPLRCQGADCGRKCDLEMHHEDYSKPYDVLWLCTKCHGKTRRKGNKPVQRRAKV